MKKRKIVALVCVAAVLLLAVSAFGYVQSKSDKINKVPDTVDVTLWKTVLQCSTPKRR